jgi:hypothetical protein
MLVCRSCGREFPTSLVIGGKLRVLNRRRYCLNCSPFGSHNTRRIHLKCREPPCAGCGVATRNPKFCSNRCQQAHRWQGVKRVIAETGAVPAGVSGHSAGARRYLLETRGHACSVCGGTRWCGAPIPLLLDHVDGDATNWLLTNLRLVCGNCDMQLPTYKSRNRGRGRAWRRTRYARGQSY